MSQDKDAPAEQIIIVRRHGHDEDHHHGGVWKIAFADFMTALMAFFLVMWLINASNTETRARVASYFNPIKLTDTVARRKGLQDIDERSNQEDTAKGSRHPVGSGAAKDKTSEKEKSGAREKYPRSPEDAPLPDGGQDQKSGKASESTSPGPRRGRGETPAVATAEPGRAFRDPFSPPTSVTELSEDPAASPQKKTPTTPQNAPRTAQSSEPENREAEANRILREAQESVARLGITGGPGLDVTIEGEGIVLSLTDTTTFGMFAVGSAEPNAQLIKLMQGVAAILSENRGRLIIRGHTDSRPFRGDARNNNWRLAVSRAEAAYGMLLKAGVEEARFERIEGYADRKPKISSDTEAAANRRIDILIRRGE